MKKFLLQPAIFSLFLFVIWLFLFLKYLALTGFPSGLPLLFSGFFAVGHAAEFSFGALLITALLCLFPRKIKSFLVVLTASGATLFLIADYFTYRQFRLHIDHAMLSMFFGESSGDIFIFPMVMYVQTVAGVLLVFAVVAIAWSVAGFLAKLRLSRKILACYLIFLIPIVAYNGIYAWARFNMYTPVVAQTAALPLSHPLSLNGTLLKLGFEPAKDLPRFSSKALHYPLETLEFSAPEQSLNLVVIMLDGWRFDMLTEDIAPNIYEFSRGAQRFNMHNAASNHTRHGVFSFFYGLPGVYWRSTLVDKVPPVLMERMRELDYQFGVFASAGLTSPEFHQTVFVNVPDLELHIPTDDKDQRDVIITDKFIHFMDTRDKNRPFFSFLFYDSTHAYIYDAEISPPKFLPDDSKNYFSNASSRILPEFNRYKNSVVFADVLVKRVLDRLKSEGLLENTVVLITSDHGEEFDDLGLGYYGHNGNFSRFQVQVPFVLYWPGDEGADYTYPTSHLDVAPTLLQGLFGCTSSPDTYSGGINLFLPQERPYAFMAGRSGGYGIQIGDYITAFPVVGPSYTVRADDYSPADWKMPLEIYKDILDDLSRFKR